ncbi:sigma-70 family RNA polymerase sigma factor [Streptomyces sp. NPDC057509]|uniref:sigma-70 family RNA polymerase sigma factor n=1 Tax=Streptomyces sp. NPDC057509 TaxID=3346152 RepID=UPI0036B04DCE
MAITVTTEQIKAAQAGDQDVMWDILVAHEPMMWKIIRSVAPSATETQTEDMIQEARAVLLTHIRAYDTEAGAASLATYAHTAIRRAVAEEWLGTSTLLTVDKSAALRVRRALWEREGDVDGAWEIVSSNEDPRRRMSREAFVSVCEALAEVQCLEGPAQRFGAGGGEQDTTLADTLPDTSSAFTDATERRDLALWLLNEIPQRQAYALRAFYGIGMSRLSEDEAADDLQIRKAPLRVLRTRGVANARSVAAVNDIAA